jgi:hypothetical protein
LPFNVTLPSEMRRRALAQRQNIANDIVRAGQGSSRYTRSASPHASMRRLTAKLGHRLKA